MNNLSNNLTYLFLFFCAFIFLSIIDSLYFGFEDWTMTIISWSILILTINNFCWIAIPLRGFIWLVLFLSAVYLFWLAHDQGNFNLDDAKLAVYGAWYWMNVILWSLYILITIGAIRASATDIISPFLMNIFGEREKISDRRYKKGYRLGELIKSPEEDGEGLDEHAQWNVFYLLYFLILLLIILNGWNVYHHQETNLMDLYLEIEKAEISDDFDL